MALRQAQEGRYPRLPLGQSGGPDAVESLPQVKQHHLALPYAQVPSALSLVWDSTAHTLAKLVLEFMVLTAARSGQVRNAN